MDRVSLESRINAWQEEIEGVSELLEKGDLEDADLGRRDGSKLEEETVNSEEDDLDI